MTKTPKLKAAAKSWTKVGDTIEHFSPHGRWWKVYKIVDGIAFFRPIP